MATYNEDFLYEGDMKIALEHPTMKQILTKFESDAPDYRTVYENDCLPILPENNYEEEDCLKTINPNDIFNNSEDTSQSCNIKFQSINEIRVPDVNSELFPIEPTLTPAYSDISSVRQRSIQQDHSYTSLRDAQAYSETNINGFDLEQSSYYDPLTPNSISNLNIKEEDTFVSFNRDASTPYSSYSGIMSPEYSIGEPSSPAESSSTGHWSPAPSKQHKQKRSKSDGYKRKPRESLVDYSDVEKKERVRGQNNEASFRYRQRKNSSKKEKEQYLAHLAIEKQQLKEQFSRYKWDNEVVCNLLTELNLQ